MMLMAWPPPLLISFLAIDYHWSCRRRRWRLPPAYFMMLFSRHCFSITLSNELAITMMPPLRYFFRYGFHWGFRFRRWRCRFHFTLLLPSLRWCVEMPPAIHVIDDITTITMIDYAISIKYFQMPPPSPYAIAAFAADADSWFSAMITKILNIELILPPLIRADEESFRYGCCLRFQIFLFDEYHWWYWYWWPLSAAYADADYDDVMPPIRHASRYYTLAELHCITTDAFRDTYWCVRFIYWYADIFCLTLTLRYYDWLMPAMLILPGWWCRARIDIRDTGFHTIEPEADDSRHYRHTYYIDADITSHYAAIISLLSPPHYQITPDIVPDADRPDIRLPAADYERLSWLHYSWCWAPTYAFRFATLRADIMASDYFRWLEMLPPHYAIDYAVLIIEMPAFRHWDELAAISWCHRLLSCRHLADIEAIFATYHVIAEMIRWFHDVTLMRISLLWEITMPILRHDDYDTIATLAYWQSASYDAITLILLMRW